MSDTKKSTKKNNAATKEDTPTKAQAQPPKEEESYYSDSDESGEKQHNENSSEFVQRSYEEKFQLINAKLNSEIDITTEGTLVQILNRSDGEDGQKYYNIEKIPGALLQMVRSLYNGSEYIRKSITFVNHRRNVGIAVRFGVIFIMNNSKWHIVGKIKLNEESQATLSTGKYNSLPFEEIIRKNLKWMNKTKTNTFQRNNNNDRTPRNNTANNNNNNNTANNDRAPRSNYNPRYNNNNNRRTNNNNNNNSSNK